MADAKVSDRSKRKALERVDTGAYGMPLRFLSWRRKMRSKWSGLIGLSVLQAGIGIMLCGLVGVLLHVPANPLSIVFLALFAIGSALAGPVVFSVWTILLLEISGLFAGLIAGAWVGLPSWWRMEAERWNGGQSVPSWLMVAVPAWMLLWIASSWGIGRLANLAADRFSLNFGYNAATRYSEEDRAIHDEAFRSSDLTPEESRALISRDAGDGAMMAIDTPVVERRPAPVEAVPSEARSAPEAVAQTRPADGPRAVPASPSKLDLSVLDDGSNDEEIRRAAGLSSAPASLPVETRAAREDLPAIPASEQAPTAIAMGDDARTVAPPAPPVAVQPLPSLSMSRRSVMMKRLQHLLLTYEEAAHEDMLDAYLQGNEDELAKLSDEEMRCLDGMEGAGQLRACALAVKESRLSRFMRGEASPPVEQGVGQLAEPSEEEPSSSGETAADGSTAVVDEVEDGAEAVGSVEAETSAPTGIEAMVDAWMSTVGAGSGRRRTAPATEPRPEGDDQASAVAVDGAATADAPNATDASAPPPHEDDGADGPRDDDAVPDAERRDDAAADAAEPQAVEAETAPAVDDRRHGDDPLSISATGSDGSKVVFEVALKDADDRKEEDMAASFSRATCKQVLGLVGGDMDPQAIALDVQEFERDHPGVMVSQVINSRSFDEHVGDAAAHATRHAWRDVAKILSQSGVERLSADFVRLNARARELIEQPHLLTQAIFYSFETDSKRVREAVGMSDEMMSATHALYRENSDYEVAMRRILSDRARAAERAAAAPPPVAVDDGAAASKGRDMLSAMMGKARTTGIVGVMAEAGTAAPAPVPTPAPAPAAAPQAAADESTHSEPAAPPAAPGLGEDGFVSPYEPGTREYDAQMEDHEALVTIRQARAERQRLADEEEANRLERERKERMDRERDDEARETAERRAKLLEGDADYVEAQRARATSDLTAARLREQASRTAIATADAAALREREESNRSEAEKRIIEEYRQRHEGAAVPEALASTEVLEAAVRLAEARSYMSGMIARASNRGMDVRSPDGVEQLVSHSQRVVSLATSDTGMAAQQVRRAIAQRLDLPVTASADEIRERLAPLDHAATTFFEGIEVAIDRGATAEKQLDGAVAAVLTFHREAQAGARIGVVEEEKAEADRMIESLQRTIERISGDAADKDRAFGALEAQLRDALADAGALRKALAGEVDDDFQRFIEKYGRAADDSMKGFYLFVSPDLHAVIILATFPASMAPGGVLHHGSQETTLAEEVDFLFRSVFGRSRGKSIFLYTDADLASVISEGDFRSKPEIQHVSRLVPIFSDYLDQIGIATEEEGK